MKHGSAFYRAAQHSSWLQSGPTFPNHTGTRTKPCIHACKCTIINARKYMQSWQRNTGRQHYWVVYVSSCREKTWTPKLKHFNRRRYLCCAMKPIRWWWETVKTENRWQNLEVYWTDYTVQKSWASHLTWTVSPVLQSLFMHLLLPKSPNSDIQHALWMSKF